MNPGRVIIVEDSLTSGAFLRRLVEEAGFEVVGMAQNGIVGERLIREKNPSLVLSDIRMPEADGIEMTTKIMRSNPVPIVLITAHDPANPELIFQAMEAGALEVLPKPPAPNDPHFEKYRKHFTNTLQVLSGLPVVKRIEPEKITRKLPVAIDKTQPPVIAIGASTGGPALLADLVTALRPGTFTFGVITQHMVPDFLPSFCDWLRTLSPSPLRIAREHEYPETGVIYVAPPHFHLRYHRDGYWKLLASDSIQRPHLPSIDLLFESLGSIRNHKLIAILLTGMGTDGSAGMKKLREMGAITIAQDPASAVVSSMPDAAIRQKAASYIMTPAEIEAWLRA